MRLPAFVLAACLATSLLPCRDAAAQAPLGPARPRETDVDALHRAAERSPKDADAWSRYAAALMARDGLEDRLRASLALRRAVDLKPRDPGLRIQLADLYFRQGYYALSRRQLQTAIKVDPDNSPAYTKLGRMALRDWRKYQQRGSLDMARMFWRDGARRAPDDPDPWIGLGILGLVDHDPLNALAAGRQVLARPRELPARTTAEALLLVGAGAYGVGLPEVADSAFTQALSRLTGPIRDHLTDITPAASDRDTAEFNRITDSGARERFLAAFWRGRDPDLTTPYNEAKLEFLSRATLAYFLFYDAKRRAWDERGWFLVRYGLPAWTEYNPIIPTGELGSMGPTTTNRLVWHYPDLGLAVFLEDRYLGEFYDIPVSTTDYVDFVPHPDSLARWARDGDFAMAGRGIVHTVLPRQHRLEGVARTGLFRRVEGFDPRASSVMGTTRPVGRVEAWLAVRTPDAASKLTGEAVVFRDSSDFEVARAKTSHPALCQSDSVAVMQFNFDLAAGSYVVGLSARDSAAGASGAWRVNVFIPPSLPGRLEVSDLELACGVESGVHATPFAKIDYSVYPNPQMLVSRSEPLGVYFEIYNLITNDDGKAQVSVEYEVRSTRKDKRPFFIKAVNPRKNDPVVNVARTDDVPGRARFQYVSANLAEQAPGPYRLEVRVTDLANSFTVTRTVDFSLVE